MSRLKILKYYKIGYNFRLIFWSFLNLKPGCNFHEIMTKKIQKTKDYYETLIVCLLSL